MNLYNHGYTTIRNEFENLQQFLNASATHADSKEHYTIQKGSS